MKYKAVFRRWDDVEETIFIEKELIDDIVFAVQGQFMVRTGKTVIHGGKYVKVDIYET